MTLKATFKLEDIKGYVTQKVENYNKAALNAYRFAGETFVRNARSKTGAEGGFNDITGNLRSSIGYIILMNGKQIEGDFELSGSGSGGGVGVETGLEFALQVGEQFPKGIALICVAGMHYAAAVEDKGRDVITGSALDVADQIRELLQSI